jgi:hypothetical protein
LDTIVTSETSLSAGEAEDFDNSADLAEVVFFCFELREVVEVEVEEEVVVEVVDNLEFVEEEDVELFDSLDLVVEEELFLLEELLVLFAGAFKPVDDVVATSFKEVELSSC